MTAIILLSVLQVKSVFFFGRIIQRTKEKEAERTNKGIVEE
jgi:hypothetical protein